MTEPEVRVRTIIEVTIVKDGFYSVSTFTPELWEQNRELAMKLAHEEYASLREALGPDPYAKDRAAGALLPHAD